MLYLGLVMILVPVTVVCALLGFVAFASGVSLLMGNTIGSTEGNPVTAAVAFLASMFLFGLAILLIGVLVEVR